MSLSSHESKLAQLRELLAQANSELFLLIGERRSVCLKIQDLKGKEGRYAHYDAEREKILFTQLEAQFKKLSLKELLAFSLIMEDQARAMAPGSYPSWLDRCHIHRPLGEPFEMVNPLLLKFSHPELFGRLHLTQEFEFLKDF
jgi:chorismate mutase